jgi:hypothetical protein
MIAKLILIAPVSAVPAATLLLVTRIVKVPVVTTETTTLVPPLFEPDCIESTTTSPIATALFVTMKSAEASAAKDVVSVVIVPDIHGLGTIATPVLRFVIWVTNPPAPVEYPTPPVAAGLDVLMKLDAWSEVTVAAPNTGAVSVLFVRVWIPLSVTKGLTVPNPGPV